ncbi:MAG TPA: 16S rRNA (guanine(966)-N(2))-methyltransferase RsmD [Dissulfurispiraceae bacterium]|nr:16S rRNA (guanine(966)-N(2))-methyltransferase RsmD [Dissulfurispiraceae bacterium]
MRIAGGSAKGRKVISRKAFACRSGEDELRPTSAKVKQAIFNILAAEVPGSRFLDLYAGTGAIGLEALSRGAERAVFVDRNVERIRLIRELAERFHFAEQAETVRAEAMAYLKQLSTPFRIIFIDPPYASAEIPQILLLAGVDSVLENRGIVVLEHSRRAAVPHHTALLSLKKQYTYGDTMLSLYRKEPS